MSLDSFGQRFTDAHNTLHTSRAEVDEAFARFVRVIRQTGIPRDQLQVPITLPPSPPVQVGSLWWKKTIVQEAQPAETMGCALLFDPHAEKTRVYDGSGTTYGMAESLVLRGACGCDENGCMGSPYVRHLTLSRACDLFPSLSYKHVVTTILTAVEDRITRLEHSANGWAQRRIAAEVEEPLLVRARSLAGHTTSPTAKQG